MSVKRIALCMLAILLGGCMHAEEMRDLRAEVQRIKNLPAAERPEFPPFYLTMAFLFPGKGPDPFAPFAPRNEPPSFETVNVIDASCLPPWGGCVPSELELFPLDALRLVGMLQDSGQDYGLIQTPEGTVHPVREGDLLGLNHGRVIALNDHRVDVIEWIAEGGCFRERPAAIAMSGLPREAVGSLPQTPVF